MFDTSFIKAVTCAVKSPFISDKRKRQKLDATNRWYRKMMKDPKFESAERSRKSWLYIKKRIEEDGDVIGAEEFKTPDGIIYYVAGMLAVIQSVKAHKEFMRERDRRIRREKYAERMKNPEWLDRRRKRTNAYQKRMRAESPQHKIAGALRIRLCNVIREHGGRKAERTAAIVGCSIDQLKSHLESQFAPGMDWSNFGRKKGIQCWEIDHILPCASFDLTDPEQQKRCFHFTNLQPLWATENRKKSAKVDSPLTTEEAVAT